LVATGDAHVCQLRWFLLAPEARGQGAGALMIATALGYARAIGCTSVTLWTFAELGAAIALYRRHGFTVVEEKTHEIWGSRRTELRMACALA
ncbi:MAG TPA: GNAT family N-acetyltransferase, partial [Hyphomicrobiaceae bacterium]|nr:GNAT family N-acetyltransferase [Hyphomicrobiaceae bacterium]